MKSLPLIIAFAFLFCLPFFSSAQSIRGSIPDYDLDSSEISKILGKVDVMMDDVFFDNNPFIKDGCWDSALSGDSRSAMAIFFIARTSYFSEKVSSLNRSNLMSIAESEDLESGTISDGIAQNSIDSEYAQVRDIFRYIPSAVEHCMGKSGSDFDSNVFDYESYYEDIINE